MMQYSMCDNKKNTYEKYKDTGDKLNKIKK